MSKVTGVKCDVCSKFFYNKNGTGKVDAPLWITVTIVTNEDIHSDQDRDICSDRCLVKFARERVSGNGSPVGPKRVQRERRVHSMEFKNTVVNEYLSGATYRSLARKHDLNESLVRNWVSQYERERTERERF